MSKAAAAGDESGYKESLIQKQYWEDRIEYVRERNERLKTDPAISAEDAESLMKIIKAERKSLDDYTNGAFRTKYISLLYEAIELRDTYRLLADAEESIHKKSVSDNSGYCAPFAPDFIIPIVQGPKGQVRGGKINGLDIEAGCVGSTEGRKEYKRRSELWTGKVKKFFL